MKKNYLPLFALSVSALVMLSACETQQVCDAQDIGVGSVAVPGTPEDFRANIKDRVFFNFNEATITADAHKTIDSQAAWGKTYPNTKMTVEAHADDRGTADYNMALSGRRGNAVEAALAKAGIDKARLAAVPFGKNKPIVPDATTEEQHAQNRVAVTVIGG